MTRRLYMSLEKEWVRRGRKSSRCEQQMRAAGCSCIVISCGQCGEACAAATSELADEVAMRGTCSIVNGKEAEGQVACVVNELVRRERNGWVVRQFYPCPVSRNRSRFAPKALARFVSTGKISIGLADHPCTITIATGA